MTKRGLRYSDTAKSFDYLCDAFSLVYTAGHASPTFRGIFFPLAEKMQLHLSAWKIVTQHSGFHSCALSCKVSRRAVFAKIPSLPLAHGILFFQSLTKVHEYWWGSEQRPTSNWKLSDVSKFRFCEHRVINPFFAHSRKPRGGKLQENDQVHVECHVQQMLAVINCTQKSND